MTLGKYLMDKLPILMLNILGLFFLAIYLLALGNSPVSAVLIGIVWLFTLSVYTFLDYRRRKRYFDRIFDTMDELDQPYLIHEFLGKSWRLEDGLYEEILRRSNKAVTEQIHALSESQKEYREFVECWIHEVKLPITGMRLAYHNEKRGGSRRIETYLTEVDNAVERVLFFARSDQVYKDYRVAAADLKQTVLSVVNRNKYLLMQNGMSVSLPDKLPEAVTDKKWLEFILTQIISNAVKYKREDHGEISFSAEEDTKAVKLIIHDSGVGIAPEDLPRVFDKGFTGHNGRNTEVSTGIGLYLCRKLCRKLEIGIEADSKQGEYTEIRLTFPKNSYLSKL